MIKFWIWVEDQWQEISLDETDDEWSHSESYPTEEGWHSSSIQLTYKKGVVIKEYNSRDSDCDGPLERSSTWEWDGETTHVSYDREHRVPDWKEVDSSQRDYFAEKMGY